jgi:hypothetical protein
VVRANAIVPEHLGRVRADKEPAVGLELRQDLSKRPGRPGAGTLARGRVLSEERGRKKKL